MDAYHVGCGIAGIYAGTLKKNGQEWHDKSEVTDEAIECVRDWLVSKAQNEGKKKFGYSWKLKNGGSINLFMQMEDYGDADSNFSLYNESK